MEEKKNITIKIENEDLIAPMYLQYDGQSQPQPAFVEIDPRGDDEITVSAEVNHNIGPSCSQDQFNGVVWSIPCNPYVLGKELADYLESEDFKAKVTELCTDYSCEWDGSNWKGSWNNDVHTISESIHMDLMSLDGVEIFDGDEWIEDSITYYNDERDEVNYSHEATKAIYDKQGKNIEVVKENIEAIAKDSEKYIDQSCQLVEGIEEALMEIIEELEYNKE